MRRSDPLRDGSVAGGQRDRIEAFVMEPSSTSTFTTGPVPNTVRSADGNVLTVQEGWILFPPGDAALNRIASTGACLPGLVWVCSDRLVSVVWPGHEPGGSRQRHAATLSGRAHTLAHRCARATPKATRLNGFEEVRSGSEDVPMNR